MRKAEVTLAEKQQHLRVIISLGHLQSLTYDAVSIAVLVRDAGVGVWAVYVLVELVLGDLQGAPGLGVVGDLNGGSRATQ